MANVSTTDSFVVSPVENNNINEAVSGHQPAAYGEQLEHPLIYYVMITAGLMFCCLALIISFYWYHHRTLIKLIHTTPRPPSQQQRSSTPENENGIDSRQRFANSNNVNLPVYSPASGDIIADTASSSILSMAQPVPKVIDMATLHPPNRAVTPSNTRNSDAVPPSPSDRNTPDSNNTGVAVLPSDHSSYTTSTLQAPQPSVLSVISVTENIRQMIPSAYPVAARYTHQSTPSLPQPAFQHAAMEIANSCIPYGGMSHHDEEEEDDDCNLEDLDTLRQRQQAVNVVIDVASERRTTLTDITTSSSNESAAEEEEADWFDSVSTRMKRKHKNKHRHKKHCHKHHRKRKQRRMVEGKDEECHKSPKQNNFNTRISSSSEDSNDTNHR